MQALFVFGNSNSLREWMRKHHPVLGATSWRFNRATSTASHQNGSTIYLLDGSQDDAINRIRGLHLDVAESFGPYSSQLDDFMIDVRAFVRPERVIDRSFAND